MTQSSNFWDNIAEKYAAKPIDNMESFHDSLSRAKKHLKPTMKALEIGCGTGTRAIEFSEHVKSLFATDISAKMIEIAKSKMEAQKNLTFAQATLDDSAIKNQKFDVVIAFNVIHLMEEPAAQIKKISSCLESGGLFISKSACISAWYLKLLIFVMRLLGKAPKVYGFTLDEHRQFLSDADFEILEDKVYVDMAPSHFVVARKK